MRQNEKQKKSNSKLLNVVGRKLRALHTAKCRFVSWFTILGHRMARPTGWMERDQEFFFFIVSIQLHSLHKAFVHLCYVVVIPISHKQRRLRGFYTPDAFFFFFFSLAQSQASIRNSTCWLGDGRISKRGKGWAGFWVASVVSDGAAATSKVPQSVAPMHWNEWF